MKTLAVYDTNGRIDYVCTVSEATAALPEYAGALEIAEHVAPSLWYVQDGALAQRPPCPATLDGQVLNNLPVPCTILVNTHSYACTDTSAELELSPGTYTIVVQSFPAQDGIFTLTV